MNMEWQACTLEEIGEIRSAQKMYETSHFYVPDDHIRWREYVMYLDGQAYEAS